MLQIPCIGRYDDFGVILSERLVETALDVFASFNEALLIVLKEKKPENGARLEPRGLVISFRNDGCPVIAGLSLAEEKIRKLAVMIEELANQHAASLARLRKLAGRLRFSQSAVMGRFGRAALRQLCDLFGTAGGKPSPEFKE